MAQASVGDAICKVVAKDQVFTFQLSTRWEAVKAAVCIEQTSLPCLIETMDGLLDENIAGRLHCFMLCLLMCSILNSSNGLEL